MIGFLKGKLLQKLPPFILLDVNGVGYELEAPMATFYMLPQENEEVSLFTHLVVREDAQLLFGFSDQAQRQLFRLLLRINGVGPKVALAILSTLSAEEFVFCIRNEDADTLVRVPGIGKKTAERMIIDMRDRISELGESGSGEGSTTHSEVLQTPIQDAIGALVSLGYKPVEANKAVRAVESEHSKRDDLIRNALQYLTKR
ncbi:MAG: Holliday junction branch migration protein RuvA [Gammaproteobacteria bacterium]|nr:Holliday junction branch migration protein RuvA [Gammaproteobacteria bacterium]